MAKISINEHLFTIHSETSQTFRCGKTITTVELRKADTEITINTAGDWKQLLGVENTDTNQKESTNA
jgi:hypothetical protein